VGQEPQKEGKSGTENEAGDDGEVEGSVLAAMDNVAGEFAEAEGELGADVEESADNYEDGSEQEQSAAEVAERIHGSIIEETACAASSAQNPLAYIY